MNIAIAYIPVVHQGYLDFFTKVKPDILYVLGEEFFADFRPIEKDIRKLSPTVICQQLLVSDTGISDIRVLTQQSLSDVIRHTSNSIQSSMTFDVSRLRTEVGHTFVLPSEDISRLFAEKYLADQNVEFIDFFLRWDTEASLKQREIKEKLLLDTTSFEKQILGQAYEEAEKSSDLWRQVGAVIVKDKKVLLHTHNHHLPTDHSPYTNGDPRGNFKKGNYIELSTAMHAEAGLIATAAKQGLSLEGCDLFVTTFPCPPCAKQVAYSGIKRLYYTGEYSMLDGEEVLKDQGVELIQVTI